MTIDPDSMSIMSHLLNEKSSGVVTNMMGVGADLWVCHNDSHIKILDGETGKVSRSIGGECEGIPYLMTKIGVCVCMCVYVCVYQCM